MRYNKIKFGLDFCPATKNMTHPVYCKNCDFRGNEHGDCCECKYGEVIGDNRKKRR